MSEENIIKNIEKYLSESAINEKDSNFFKNGGWEIIDLEIAEAIKGILDLYNKEKEKNEKYKEVIDKMAKKLNQYGFFCVDPVKEYDVNSEIYLKAKTTEEIKEYFYRKVENE